MRKSQIAVLTFLSLWSSIAVAQVACPTANPITVNRTTGGTGVSGSLPWAINCLNNVTTLTTIQFNIAGAGPHVIQPVSNAPLPTVTKANAHIDGSTDNIIIDGSLGQAQGLVIAASNVRVNGLTLRNFASTAFPYGLRLSTGNGHQVSACQIFDNQVGISIARSVGSFDLSFNYIGTDKSNTNLSNNVAGIQAEAFAGATFVPTATIESNTIGFNPNGIQDGTGRNITISRNTIFCNTSNGIDRGAALTTPTISSATTTRITGTAPASSTVEVFRSDNTGCTNAPCQGRFFIGTVTTNAFGAWTLNISAGLSAGQQVTATATLNNNTSEFSACRAIVDVCANFFASIKSNDVTCNGGSNGSATVSATGGSGQGINFTWSNGATTATISNLRAGTYMVTATDNAGCQSIQAVNILQPTAINITTSSTNVVCNGDRSGAINAAVTGGIGPYTYLWSTGATTSTITSVVAGTYGLTVTDQNNCTKTATASISQPPALSLLLNGNDTLCFGAKNGTALASVSGGVAPYGYNWSTNATTSALSNLGAGNYTVTVTDQNKCSRTGTISVIETKPLQIDSTVVQPQCAGESTGGISIKISGGTPNYIYLWENGSTTNVRTDLKAGDYKVGVTDANRCTESWVFTLKDPAPISGQLSTTEPACFGQNTGTATIIITSPGNHTYRWSTGATTTAIGNLGAGRYNLTVTNANACTATFPFTINAPSAGLDVTTRAVDIDCFGANTGQITTNTTGGKAPYIYLWSNGSTTMDLSNLTAGTYALTVSDQAGCADTATVSIRQNPVISTLITSNNPACFGQNNGQASVSVSGGIPGYSYVWSNGATSSTISGLMAGKYVLTVTDARQCSKKDSIQLNAPTQIQATASVTNVNCNGTATGSAQVTVSGGTGPYTYAWSNGATTSAINNLAAGTYSVTVTNSANCKETVSGTVTAPAALTLSITPTNLRCNGQNQGQAVAIAGGGVAPYAYRWSNGATSSSISALAAGNFSLTLTDANQCTRTQSVSISEPPALQASVTFTRETSPGARNGTASASGSGGTAPYRFRWSTGATTTAISGLAPGVYSVTVEDANGCTNSRSGTVSGESCPALSVSGIVSDLTCSGGETGSISLTIVGGAMPYLYSWSNGETTANLSELNEGTYSVTVSDANGCTGNFSTTLKAGSRQPKPLYGIVAPDTVCGNETFTLRADDLFQGPGVRYIWQLPNGEEMSSTTPSLKLKATSSAFLGEYSALRDSAGCRSSIFGPVIVDVISLPPNSFSAGKDTTICQGTSIDLRAQAPATGKATWFALSSRTTIQNPNSPTTSAQNLNVGANRFVWRVALGRCIQAAADTVTVFLETPPQAMDDKYTIERAQDVAAMNVLLNDNLTGLQDTTITWIGAPDRGNFEFISTSKSFRYTAEADFRGVLRFTYLVCNEASRCANPCDSAGVTIEVFNLPKPTEGMVLEDPGPNGTLQIRGLQGFSSVDITITNRWGDIVYRNNNYDNNAPWRGRAGDSGPFLPPGAYYYVLLAYDNGSLVGKPQTGAIYLFKKDQQ